MSPIPPAVLVFLGAGTGGVLRYFVDRAVAQPTPPNFPLGTLLINLSGSFLIGLAYPTLAKDPYRLLLITGVLGGYTTFSAFSREALSLIDANRPLEAGGYVFASLLGGLVAVYVATRLAVRFLT